MRGEESSPMGSELPAAGAHFLNHGASRETTDFFI